MTKEASRKSLSKEIEVLRQQGRPVESTDSEVLPCFISALCGKMSSDTILEYTNIPCLLTGLLTDTNAAQLTFVVPNKQFSDTLRIVFDDLGPFVFDAIKDLSPNTTYSTIICMPPFGFMRPGDKAADGFGGEIVRELLSHLSPRGTLFWVTGRGVVFNARAKKTLTDLEALNLYAVACIETAPGMFFGAMTEGAVIALRREKPEKRFVAMLRDLESAVPTANAFIAGPTRKEGSNWIWLDQADPHTFLDLERSRLLQRLMPRGRHTEQPLSAFLYSTKIEKADRPIPQTDEPVTYLYVPEYAGSLVTSELAEQTVKPKAVYRMTVDPKKANSRFLAQLLNSSYGKELRASVSAGATIQRVSAAKLLELRLPIPDMKTQDRIARTASDIGLLQASFIDMKNTLDQDWSALSDISEKIDSLKAVLDIERQIANWWRELPYPLATIYRRYQVSLEPKERLDTLLHFFEMMAVYLATIGTSHVKALRSDWQDVMAKWLHPKGAAGIERADFGFWINLAGVSLKDMSRIASDKELQSKAIEIAGPELVQLATKISPLRKATEPLDVARRYRNSWKGHGGHMKASDATRLDDELQQSIRDLYEMTASIFRHFQLVRPGMAEVTDDGFKFQIERLSGSDPTFEKECIELDRPTTSKVLSFWMSGARTICRALPFFRLGAPQQPQETSFYVFNRVENGGFRWISYQEAIEQDFVAPDDELLGIISLGKTVA